MHLSEIPKLINCKKITNFKKDLSFNFLSTNSKYIKKNSILIAVKKNNFKEKYVKDAIKKGTIAIISDFHFKNINIPQFVVNDISKSLSKLLFQLKKYPPRNLVGITGTNGKTSVVSNIKQIVSIVGKKIKTYGTLGYYKNLKKIEDSILTTPEYDILYQKAFSRKKNNYEFVFEISSHSITKKRIKDLPINIAALTNISHDHLDFHKTLANYKKTKLKLFFKYLNKKGIAVLNDEIKNINNVKKRISNRQIKILTFGSNKSDIFVYTNNKNTNLKIYNKNFKIKKINYNKFELSNLSCSIACCVAMGININSIVKSIIFIKKPEGRLQKVSSNKNVPKIYIDYAHTPDALKNILISNTSKKNNKPNVLFGCGGDRDKSKRKKMGIIANRYANKVYITDDNPRNEDPSKIRRTIINSCKKAIEVPGRRNAIKKAINELNLNEILIIAGRGHEKKQIIKNKEFNLNDFQTAKLFVSKKKYDIQK